MGQVIVMNGLTLDGVMQSPARPDEGDHEQRRRDRHLRTPARYRAVIAPPTWNAAAMRCMPTSAFAQAHPRTRPGANTREGNVGIAMSLAC